MAKRILITTDRLGAGDDELGRVLMRNFVYSLARAERLPAAVMLANEGVRLACEGSDVIDDLRLLVEAGVTVRSCGTCLDFLGMKESLAVGVVGTMAELVDGVTGDDAVVTIA
ncbi:MAG: sulfurtransferase-like selenium metabolism protein YedF [Actinobacteria bacterium HGW-Actinobacteria-10]|jgi:selenium metabolism protein YedF|nr:MAG: sulfurtransferase-like selenium metabolism protein YedF [Actinobacteria bacterium HGW-Actinobacteria-10]